MKRLVMAVVLVFMCSLSHSQIAIDNYIKSYPKWEDSSTVEINNLRKMHTKMTKEEALAYVVNGDTTKLYCPDLDYDGWEEKIYGMTISEYMPAKCIRVDYDNYYLLCYEVTECDNNGVRHKSTLIFEIIDKSYIKRDSLVAYKRDDYEVYIKGLYNFQTRKIYLYNQSELGGNWWSVMYRINSKTMKFEEIIRHDGNINVKLDKQINALGWDELFYSDDCQQ